MVGPDAADSLLCRPLVGNIIEVNVDLNITGEILAERNEAGNVHLVIGDCSHSPSMIKVTLLNG